MRIKLQSLFGLETLTAFGGDEVELNANKIKLRDFLTELSIYSNGSINLIDTETGNVVGQYFILLNGRGCLSLKNGLDTELKDGDEIGIGPIDLCFSGG